MNKPASQTIARLFHARWFYVVNILLICLVSFSFVREMVRSRDIAKQIQMLQNQSESLQTQHLAIGELKNAVQTETFAESEARLKLGLKKPGESLVILKNEKTKGVQINESNANREMGAIEENKPSQKSLANSTKWWYYFFNKQAYRDAKSL